MCVIGWKEELWGKNKSLQETSGNADGEREKINLHNLTWQNVTKCFLSERRSLWLCNLLGFKGNEYWKHILLMQCLTSQGNPTYILQHMKCYKMVILSYQRKKNEQKFPSLWLHKHTSPLKSYMFKDRQDGGREDGINCENSLSMQHCVLKELSAEQSPTEKSTFFSQKATNV